MKKRSFLAALAVSMFAFSSVAFAIDRDVTVHNHIGATVRELYVSPSSTTSWGGDLLGADVLRDGGSVLIHYTPRMYRGECVFDMKIVEQDGTTSTVSGVNLCTITDVTLNRSGGEVVFDTN